MTPIEKWTLLAAVALYCFSFGLFLADTVWRRERLVGAGMWLMLAAFIGHTTSIVSRWYATGHPPVFGSFENALAGSWVLALVGLLLFMKAKWLRTAGQLTAPMAVAAIAYGLRFDVGKFPLTISEQSLWVDVHVVFAWLSYSSYTLALLTAGLMLVKARRPNARLSLTLPDKKILDDRLLKFIVYGFVTQTFTIASGSYYEFLVFGSWWRWDPVESLTLVSWFMYALFIHLKRSFGWSGTRLAWLAVASMVGVIVAYWMMTYFPTGTTFHVFDIGTREHIL